MSLCHFRGQNNDEAARVFERLRYGRLCGQGRGLPLAVVGLHENLFASCHSEMASDINRFVSNFALCAGALFKLNVNGYFHRCSDVNAGLRAESGLGEYRRPYFSKR